MTALVNHHINIIISIDIAMSVVKCYTISHAGSFVITYSALSNIPPNWGAFAAMIKLMDECIRQCPDNGHWQIQSWLCVDYRVGSVQPTLKLCSSSYMAHMELTHKEFAASIMG